MSGPIGGSKSLLREGFSGVNFLVVVNGRLVNSVPEYERALENEDKVTFFPVFAGG